VITLCSLIANCSFFSCIFNTNVYRNERDQGSQIMPTILLTWELGGGIGHLMNLRPIGQELVRRGHRVIAALRDISRAGEIFGGTGIEFLPAPVHRSRDKPPFEPEQGFCHLLANIGFADERSLSASFTAWNTLLDWIKPDLVVADHSPTALLALWGRPIPRVNVGLGFFCPLDTFPLPHVVRKDDPQHQERMIRNEVELTGKVNLLLQRARRPLLTRLSQLFNQIDEVVLATYREFDHYGARPDVRYWGHWPFGGGIEPVWPAGEGPRVYAYLKPFPALQELLRFLHRARCPTLIFAGGIESAVQDDLASPTLRFENRPLNLHLVAQQCDLVITNGGHGTTVGILLAGKPCVLVPLFTEQLMFALKVKQIGAAALASRDNGPQIVAAINDVLNKPSYRDNAEAFAARYAHFIPGEQIPELADSFETTLSSRAIFSNRSGPLPTGSTYAQGEVHV
jgi:UDP:flavonoid glycosyltransferase YjiC (YdhE family)